MIINKLNIKNKQLYYLLIFIIIILGYFQISFFIFPLKFGAIAFHYPWRFIIIDNIRDGALPLWYFNQHLGVPIYADPQSGAWYPFVWLFSLFGNYTLYSFHIEFIIHVVIGAFGLYILAQELNISKYSSFIISVVYVFSGIYADNVLLSWTISMAWIPLIINFYIRTTKDITLNNILLTSLFLFMLITGGYPSFTIVLAYLLIGIFIFKFIVFIKEKNKKAIKWIYANILIVFITFLLSCVLLLSVYYSIDFFDRTHSINIDRASVGALDYKSFISLLLPFTAVDSHKFLNTLFTMSNSYIGVVILAFVFSINNFKKRGTIILLIISSIFIIYSLGLNSPLYVFITKFFYGMDLFRYSNFIRAFFIPSLLLLASLGIDNLLHKKRTKSLIVISSILILIYLIIVGYAYFFNDLIFSYSSLTDFFKNTKFSHRVLLQSIFQVLILSSFILLLLNINNKRFRFFLAALIFLDIGVSFHLNYAYTAYAPRITVKEAQNVINKKSNKITFENNQNIRLNSNFKPIYYFDYGLANYNGEISDFGNISFRPKSYNKLYYNYPKLYQQIISNAVLYFSNQIFQYDSIPQKTVDSISKQNLYLSKNDYTAFKDEINGTEEVKYKIANVTFEPNTVNLTVSNNVNGFLTLLQNFYPGWTVIVNGVEKDITINNHTFISVFLEKGVNNVEFIYKNNKIKIAFIISVTSLMIVVLIIIATVVKSNLIKNNL